VIAQCRFVDAFKSVRKRGNRRAFGLPRHRPPARRVQPEANQCRQYFAGYIVRIGRVNENQIEVFIRRPKGAQRGHHIAYDNAPAGLKAERTEITRDRIGRRPCRVNVFGGGAANFSRPEHTLPPGYNSKEATRRLARQATDYGFLGITSEKLKEQREGVGESKEKSDTRERLRRGQVSIEEAKKKIYGNYQKAQDGLQIIIGTPKTVIPKLKLILEVLHPGVLGLFQAQGPLTTQQRMNSIRLMGQEVLPAVREIARGLGIRDPFEREPGSRPYTHGTSYEAIVDLEALKRAPKRDESVRV
jgi:hypothetical protein